MFKKQNRNEFDRFDGGWTDKKYNYMSWALSCLQFMKFYDEVELYTDEIGKELLINRLELPYTKVHVVLDDLNHYHPDLWAIGKLYTYSLQDKPFLHVDGDAYIWERFKPELDQADLVAQNEENNFSYYRRCLNEIHNKFSYIPNAVSNAKSIEAISGSNAGVFGGNDIPFIKNYTTVAFDFVNKNLDRLEKINIGLFNNVYEQHLFYNMAKEASRDIHYLTKDINEDFEGLAEFSGVSRYTKFIHVVGQYKKYKQTGENIARRILLDHPEYYFKIDGLLKDLII